VNNHYPPFIQKMEKIDPVFFRAVAESHDLALAPGALDPKVKSLILLAVDAFAGSSGVSPLADAARRAGATEAEIIEALRLAYCIGGNKVLSAAMAAFREDQ
jgi:alkylhydroperoxidase/carboxymuconolactone decarboxylase family protein YurZ